MKKNKALAVPFVLWAILFIAVPLVMVVWYGVTVEETPAYVEVEGIDGQTMFQLEDGTLTAERPEKQTVVSLANFKRMLEPTYLKLLLRSLKIALFTTIFCLLLGYPVALILSGRDFKRPGLWLMLIILPMWMNFLLRTYSWMSILENSGILNSWIASLRDAIPAFDRWLTSMGVGKKIIFLYNENAVVLGMVYNYLSFMIMPIYTVIEKTDHSLLEAAADLGASPVQSFLRVTLPYSLPGVLEGIKKYMAMLPAYNLEFFRVDEPKAPALKGEDLYDILPRNTKKAYDMYNVIKALMDGGELLEYKNGYGPEMITGLAKVDGLLVGVIANRQGPLAMQGYPDYPEYRGKGAFGMGGKLYRQGLIKMNEFVTLCARDRIPLIWLQDTTGIDVGDDAEKAELLGLGQSLIYSIQNSKLPSLEVTLRKASAAAHYVLGGPQGNDTNVFSLATGASEYYVMPGETAANAMYSRKLVKAKKAGEDLQPIIDKMNDMIQMYHDKSRPKYCTIKGMADEIVDLTEIRPYIQAFTESAYQNPESICPFHQMVTPRAIREWNTFKKA